MCNFFSFVTEPEYHGGDRFFFDWVHRKADLKNEGLDSHTTICKFYKLDEDKCNKYEYNPLTKEFKIDQINSPIDDRVQVQEWFTTLEWEKIVEPILVKPIVNPLELPEVTEITTEHIELLKQWASVGDSVWDSVWASVGASVWDSVWASVRDSVRDSVGDSVGDSVWASVGAYMSSFFDIAYKYDFTPCVKLWDAGLVPSFDGTTWRLHTGKKAKIVYEIKVSDLRGE